MAGEHEDSTTKHTSTEKMENPAAMPPDHDCERANVVQTSSMTPPWGNDPKGYLESLYTRFIALVMTATFTGALHISFLSLAHALLTGNSLQLPLFPDGAQSTNPFERSYSTLSFGIMVGTFGVVFDTGAAALAAMNAVITCHYSHSPPADQDPYPDLGARVLHCVLIQIIGLGCAVISCVLLAANLDTAFMICVVWLFLLGILVLIYHAAVFLGHGTFRKGLKKYSFYCISLTIASSALTLHASVPSPHAWFTFMATFATAMHHILAAFPLRRARKDDVARIVVLFIIAGAWASCAIMTLATGAFEGAFKGQGRWAGRCKYVVFTLSVAEAGVLVAAGACDIRATVKRPNETSATLKGMKNH